MKILFMIPARSGSKGVPDKNIKLLGKKPLMAYIIDAVKNSNTFTKHECYIMLNTDSEEYQKIGQQYGAKTPFLRPKELSSDNSIITDTLKYTMDFFDNKNTHFDLIVMLQITAPFTRAVDIDRAVEMFERDNSLESLSSVTECETPPLFCNVLPENLSMKGFIRREALNKNRQELPKYYRITGAINIAKWESFKKHNYTWHKGNQKALIVDNRYSLDIDTMIDFEYAEFLINKCKNN